MAGAAVACREAESQARKAVVLAVPKRLRYFLHDDAVLQGVVVRILLRALERCLRAHSPGGSAAARLGAVVFIHRFGSSLNAHRHLHCCILDGVFAAGAGWAPLRLGRAAARVLGAAASSWPRYAGARPKHGIFGRLTMRTHG